MNMKKPSYGEKLLTVSMIFRQLIIEYGDKLSTMTNFSS